MQENLIVCQNSSCICHSCYGIQLCKIAINIVLNMGFTSVLTEGKLILKIYGKRANFLIYLVGKKKLKT